MVKINAAPQLASFSKITPEPVPFSVALNRGVVSIRTIPRFTRSTIDLKASGRGEEGVDSTGTVVFCIGIGGEVDWGVAVDVSILVGNDVGIGAGVAFVVGVGIGVDNPAMAA